MLVTKTNIELRDGTTIHVTVEDTSVIHFQPTDTDQPQTITCDIKYPDGTIKTQTLQQSAPWERHAQAIERMDRDREGL